MVGGEQDQPKGPKRGKALQKSGEKKKEKVAEVRESLKEFKHCRAQAIRAKKVGDMVLAMTLLKKCKDIKTIIIKKNDEAEKCDTNGTETEESLVKRGRGAYPPLILSGSAMVTQTGCIQFQFGL